MTIFIISDSGLKVSKVQIEKPKTKIRKDFIIQIFAHGFQQIKLFYTDRKSVLSAKIRVICVPFYLFFYHKFHQLAPIIFLVLQKKI